MPTMTLSITPPLVDYQRQALLTDARYSFIAGATKSGKTRSAMAWLLKKATEGRDGQHVFWVAPVYRQAGIPFRRMKRMLHSADPQHRIHKVNESLQTVQMVNGVTGSTNALKILRVTQS